MFLACSVLALVDTATKLAMSPVSSMPRGFAFSGLSGGDPQGRSLRHSICAGRFRQHHCSRRLGAGHRVPAGHRLPPLSVEKDAILVTTPVEELLSLPMLQLDQIKDSLHAYQISSAATPYA